MNKQQLLKSFVLNSEELRARISYNKLTELNRNIKNNAPDDIKVALATLWMEAELKVGEGGATDSTELQTKYNELVKQKKLLENDIIDLRNEIKTMESDMKDYKYRCDIIVNNTEKTNKVLRQKLDNVIKSWTDDGGEENDIFNIINKDLSCVADMEFRKVDDPNYDYYSDEVID